MKKLSLVFGFIAIMFLTYGLYILCQMSKENYNLFLYSTMFGFISMGVFLVTDRLSTFK